MAMWTSKYGFFGQWSNYVGDKTAGGVDNFGFSKNLTVPFIIKKVQQKVEKIHWIMSCEIAFGKLEMKYWFVEDF